MKALIFKTEEGFTISNVGSGGAIISAPTRDEAKTKFLEAMNLCFAVDKLMKFSKTRTLYKNPSIEFIDCNLKNIYKNM